MEIENKVIIVTGASSGIGLATAQKLANQGARVVLAARSREKLEQLAARLPGSLAAPADVTRFADAQNLVDRTLSNYGRIDGLVNCAGQGMFAPVEKVDLDEYRTLLELNVVAPLQLMQLVIPQMRKQGGGTILNVSSMSTRRYIPNIAGYASTKYALNALSLTARQELAGDGIVVSIIRASLVDTDFGQNAPSPEPGALRRAPDGSLLPSVLSPEQVAEKISELIRSGEAEFDLVQTP